MYFDKKFARRDDIEVTLISRENFILFTPMLHEVAAGDLYPGDIVNPLRRILRHVRFVEAEVQNIDLSARQVRCTGGVARFDLTFEFDHLLFFEACGNKKDAIGTERARFEHLVRLDDEIFAQYWKDARGARLG